MDRFGRATGRTLSRKSRRNLHGLLYSIFDVAVDEGSVPVMRNPCAKTKLPEGCEDEMVFLDHRQAEALVRRIKPFFQALVITLLGTGMRCGEAAGLQVRDLHLDAPVPYLRVRRALVRQEDGSMKLGRVKTRKAMRSITLAPEVVRVLRALVEGREGTCQVFTMPQGGFLHHGNFRYRCFVPAVQACVAAGEVPEGLRIHDLRHTHAAWLISAGRPLRAVKERLGHRSILTTDRYTHLLPTVDQDDLAVIEQALAGTTGPARGADDTSSDRLAA